MELAPRLAAPPAASSRRGYALLAALWLVVALATVGTAAALAARQTVAASHTRTALLRASWRAEGCAASALAALDGLLRAEQGRPGGVFERWRALDSALAEVGLGTDVAVTLQPVAWPDIPAWPGAAIRCTVRLEPAGARADLNALDHDRLRVLFRAVALPADRADALAAALVAWRHGEVVDTLVGTDTGPTGAARTLAAAQQLLEVPGFDSAVVAAVAPAADVEPGRLYLGRAPAAALATLPGFEAEVVARLLERRRVGAPVSLVGLAGEVSPPAARALMAPMGLLASRMTEDPDGWVLTATAVGSDPGSWAVDRSSERPGAGHSAAPSPTGTVELRVARAGWRVAVMRRRSWW